MGLWALSEAGLGKWDEAEQTIKTGESITGDSLWLLQSKIRLDIHRKELQTAGQVLEHALKVFPDSQDLWLLSAGLAEENGERTNAIEALQKVIDLDPPRNITAWGRRARLTQSQIWLKQQDFAKAKAVIAPVLKAYPSDPQAACQLWRDLRQANDPERPNQAIWNAPTFVKTSSMTRS